MSVNDASTILERLKLSQNGKTWWTRFTFEGRDDIELEILSVDGRPCPLRSAQAINCLENFATLKHQMEEVLTTAPDNEPFFPVSKERQWWLEGIGFTDDNPELGAGYFSLNEQAWDYLYISYVVHINNSKIAGFSTLQE